MLPAPNHATTAYQARIAARKARDATERKAKAAVAVLREQQRRAGSAAGSELQLLGTPDPELVRARRAERAAHGG